MAAAGHHSRTSPADTSGTITIRRSVIPAAPPSQLHLAPHLTPHQQEQPPSSIFATNHAGNTSKNHHHEPAPVRVNHCRCETASSSRTPWTNLHLHVAAAQPPFSHCNSASILAHRHCSSKQLHASVPCTCSIYNKHHLHSRMHLHHATASNGEPPCTCSICSSTHLQPSCSLRWRRRRITQHGSHHAQWRVPSFTNTLQSRLKQQGRKEEETLIWEREEGCHVSASQWTLEWSKLVKSGKKVKDWSNERGLFANIDIFGCLCKIGLQDWKWVI